jgi:hypothetical protein
VAEVTELQTEANLLTILPDCPPIKCWGDPCQHNDSYLLVPSSTGLNDHILLSDSSGSWDTSTDLWTGWYTGTRAQNWGCLVQLRMYGRPVCNLNEKIQN